MNRGTFDSDGVEIAYLDAGQGDPVLLIHGFASNLDVNWVGTGWVDAITGAGRRAIALDNRGHGRSGKPAERSAYPAPVMAEDARALLDHLEIERADVLGYSMGARITAFLALGHPERVRSAIFAGLGINLVRGFGDSEAIAQALEADDLSEVSDARGRAFRAFAEPTGSDLKALATCMRGTRVAVKAEALGRLAMPVLVVAGEDDDVAGSPGDLAALIPGARTVVIPGRNHMTAVGDRRFKEAVLAFLDGRS